MMFRRCYYGTWCYGRCSPNGTTPVSVCRNRSPKDSVRPLAPTTPKRSGGSWNSRGLDPHDWFPNLAKALAVDTRAIIVAGIDCWLLNEEVLIVSRDFVQTVVQLLL